LSCEEHLVGGRCFRLQDTDGAADSRASVHHVEQTHDSALQQSFLAEFYPPQLLTFSFGLLFRGE